MGRTYALALAIILAFCPSAHASDVSASTWTPTDASNIAASPNGWPPNMAPNQVAPVGRAMMGGLKRWYNATNMTVTSTGSANAQVITYSPVPTACIAGDSYVFKAGFTNTAAMTLNNGVCTAAVQIGASALVGGEVVSGRPIQVYYDGTVFQLKTNTGAYWDAVNKRLGIGNTTPTTLSGPGMEIYGTGTYGSGLRITSGNVGGHAYEFAPAWVGNSNTGFTLHDVTSSLNVFITNGGASNATLFSGFLGSLSLGLISTSGTNALCGVSSAYLSTYVGITFCSSDERLKDVYGGLDPAGGASALIDRLKPSSFAMTNDIDKTRHSGFIAQQVGLVMPECQVKNADGYYSIETNCILAYSVKAQQESQSRIWHLSLYLWLMAAFVVGILIAMGWVVSELRRRPV